MLQKLKWRKSCSGFSGWREGLWLTLILPGLCAYLQRHKLLPASQVALWIRKGMGLGFSWAPGVLANSLGSGKSRESQGETNNIVIVKGKPELHFCTPTDDDISWHPGVISGSLQKCNLKSHLRDADLFPVGTPYGCGRGTSQLCLSLDVGRPPVVMYLLLLFSIVSMSLLLMAVYWN